MSLENGLAMDSTFLNSKSVKISTEKSEQKGGHGAGDIFKCISINENYSNSSFTEVCSSSTINNMSVLVRIMAWLGTADKPLYEPLISTFLWCYMASLDAYKLMKPHRKIIGGIFFPELMRSFAKLHVKLSSMVSPTPSARDTWI